MSYPRPLGEGGRRPGEGADRRSAEGIRHKVHHTAVEEAEW